MFANYEGGVGFGATERKTADGAVGVSGRPTRVFSIHWLSGAASSTAILRNGTLVTDEIRYQKIGTANDSYIESFGENGILFPSGCYFDADANLTYAIITFIQ